MADHTEHPAARQPAVAWDRQFQSVLIVVGCILASVVILLLAAVLAGVEWVVRQIG